jgi:hypothetical protein
LKCIETGAKLTMAAACARLPTAKVRPKNFYMAEKLFKAKAVAGSYLFLEILFASFCQLVAGVVDRRADDE